LRNTEYNAVLLIKASWMKGYPLKSLILLKDTTLHRRRLWDTVLCFLFAFFYEVDCPESVVLGVPFTETVVMVRVAEINIFFNFTYYCNISLQGKHFSKGVLYAFILFDEFH